MLLVFSAPPSWSAAWKIESAGETTAGIKITKDGTAQEGNKKLSEITELAANDTITFEAGTYTFEAGDALTVNVSNVTITGADGTIFDGGAKDTTPVTRTTPLIVIKGESALEGITISGLTIKNANLSLSAKQTGGAGILVEGVAVTISECTFKDNTVTLATKDATGYSGGAAIYLKDAKGTVIKDCSFSGNTVDGDETGGFTDGSCHEDGGGAIYNLGTTGADDNKIDVKISNCVFSKNGKIAESNNKPYASGGAISNVTLPTAAVTLSVDIISCDFSENKAARYGGAVYNIIDHEKNFAAIIQLGIADCVFSSNELGGATNNGSHGGAIHCFSYASQTGSSIKLNVSNSSFTNNKATEAGTTSNYMGARGGAIGSVTYDEKTTNEISVQNCLFEGNEARSGGALASWENSTMTVENCTFKGNKTNAYPDGQASLYSVGSAVFTDRAKAKTTITNSTFTENDANYAGAVASYVTGTTTDVVNCTFVNNKNSGTDTASKGTEVYLHGGTINLYNTLLYNGTGGKTVIAVKSEVTDDDKVTLYSCAYSGTEFGTDATKIAQDKTYTSTASATLSSTTGQEYKASDKVTHTVFPLAKDDTAVGKGKSSFGDNGPTVPTTDILGVTRSSTAPSIGVAEYSALTTINIAISGADSISLNAGAKADEDYTATISADFSNEWKQLEVTPTWSYTSSSTDLVCTFTNGILSVSADTAASGDYTVTVKATYSSNDVTGEASKEVKVSVTGTASTKDEGTDSSAVTVTSTPGTATSTTTSDGKLRR